jgi:hypothetical protein
MKGVPKLIHAVIILALFSCQGSSPKEEEQVRAESPGSVRLCPDNPRYLEYRGKPLVLITSAEHYGALLNLDFDYRRYLETLGSEGFNYTRIFTGTYLEPVENIFGIIKNTLAPLPGRYISPWMKAEGRYDLGKFNPDYFGRLKSILEEAEKQGIVIEITLFSSIYHESAWELCPFHGDNNVNGTGETEFRRVNTLYNGELKQYQEQFIRELVREVNGYGNLFFEIQNEPWSDNPNLAGFIFQDGDIFRRSWQQKVEVANLVSMEWQAWVVSVIRDEESDLPGRHLIAQNICNFQHDLEKMPDGVSIINFHYATPDAVQMNLDLGGVLALDETGFMPHEDDLYIDQAWRFILSGGGLYNNLDYSFTAGNEAGDWPIPETNPGWGGPRFRQKLSILAKTINRVPFHKMVFSDTILKSQSATFRQVGLQIPGDTYLVFIENTDGDEFIPDVPADDYDVTWIQVDTGETRTEKLKLGDGAAIVSPYHSSRVALMITKSLILESDPL